MTHICFPQLWDTELSEERGSMNAMSNNQCGLGLNITFFYCNINRELWKWISNRRLLTGSFLDLSNRKTDLVPSLVELQVVNYYILQMSGFFNYNNSSYEKTDEVWNMFNLAGLTEVQNLVDRRLQVNRKKKVKMQRVWIQSKFQKPLLPSLNNPEETTERHPYR